MNLHRLYACSLLAGRGLEIGALHRPAWVPEGAKVEYADAQSSNDAYEAFPELRGEALVHVDHIVDLDSNGLRGLSDEHFDFVVLSHVIEHVANPIKVLRDISRVLVPGGLLVIAAPDKHHTFDRDRPSTPFAHLRAEFEAGVTQVDDEHYKDFLRHVHPEIPEGSDHWNGALRHVRERREHAHVWDSAEFHQFLVDAFALLQVDAIPLTEFSAGAGGDEYYALWRLKGAVRPAPPAAEVLNLPRTWPQPLMHELQRRSDVPALRQAVVHLQNDVASLNEAITTLREDHATTCAAAEKLAVTHESLRLEYEQSTARANAERLEASLQRAEREAHLEALIRERDQHIGKLLGSRSWRVTAPMRWAVGLLTRKSGH